MNELIDLKALSQKEQDSTLNMLLCSRGVTVELIGKYVQPFFMDQDNFNIILFCHIYGQMFFRTVHLCNAFPNFTKSFPQESVNLDRLCFQAESIIILKDALPILFKRILKHYISNQLTTSLKDSSFSYVRNELHILGVKHTEINFTQKGFNKAMTKCIKDMAYEIEYAKNMFPNLYNRFSIPKRNFHIILKSKIEQHDIEGCYNLVKLFPRLSEGFYLSKKLFFTLIIDKFCDSRYNECKALINMFPQHAEKFTQKKFNKCITNRLCSTTFYYLEQLNDVLNLFPVLSEKFFQTKELFNKIILHLFKKHDVMSLTTLSDKFPDLFKNVTIPKEVFDEQVSIMFCTIWQLQPIKRLFPNLYKSFTVSQDLFNCAIKEYDKLDAIKLAKEFPLLFENYEKTYDAE